MLHQRRLWIATAFGEPIGYPILRFNLYARVPESQCHLSSSIPQVISDYPFDISIKKLKVVEEADVLSIAVV